MDLKGLALGMVVLVITVSIGAKILNTVYATYEDNESAAALLAVDGEAALGSFGDWFPILFITGVGAAILGMLGFFNSNQ